MSAPLVTEDDLQAHVDQALDPARREDVERYLADHPEEARRLAAYAEDREALRHALAPLAERPIPPELNLGRLLAERRRPQRLAWRSAAAVLVALGLGGAAGWLGRGPQPLAPTSGVAAVGQEAAENYRVFAADRLRPVDISAADPRALSDWLSSRLDRQVAPPDLVAAGYRLMGGRLAATAHGVAALFLYQREDGARLEVFLRPMRRGQTIRMHEQAYDGLGGVAWVEGGLGCGVIGVAPAHVLHPLADEVRRQFRTAGYPDPVAG